MDFSNPITLLIHDGELSDVRDRLEELGVRFVERRGAHASPDEQASWDLVIATPKRMLDFEVSDSFPAPVRIAVLAGEARTLRTMLKREAVEFVVRRPVHPEALRLLILHTLYRGPEKRGGERVTVGAPIRVRTGWRWRRAVLVDLALRGCRLLSSHRVHRGDRIELNLPAALTGQKSLTLSGRVVRRIAHAGRFGSDAIAVNFEATFGERAQHLQAVIEHYASGPAALPSATAEHPAGDDEASAPPRGTTRAARAGRRETLGSDSPVAAAAEAGAARSERRGVRGDRRCYSRRVIALGDEVSRVLIGRDLSVGGMRVDPNAALSLGDELQIALYARKGDQPLVVSAAVHRDDGDKGLALQFRGLSRSAEGHLRKMVESLPYIEAPEEGGGEGVVVSEILDRESR